MRVFLTGGTGLLGSHTARRLASDGHEVVALCRPTSDVSALADGCRVVAGDVLDPVDILAEAMSGCSHVVHAAALVYSGGRRETVWSVNVEGAKAVMEAAALAGVGHAVHVSSVAVYGIPCGPVSEDPAPDAPLNRRDSYGRSKREAERAVRDVENRTGLPVTVLRPAGLYGEHDRLLSMRIGRMARRGVAFTLGPGRNTIPTVYAGNVADAVVRCMARAKGRLTYDLGLDHPLTQRMMVQGIAAGMGASPVVLPIPSTLIRGGAYVLRRIGMSPLRPGRVPLERVAALSLGENPYSSVRIRGELGWTPPHRHEDALWRTGRWLTTGPLAGKE
jgi:nucleoside-diphosphate-sugar epimerase